MIKSCQSFMVTRVPLTIAHSVNLSVILVVGRAASQEATFKQVDTGSGELSNGAELRGGAPIRQQQAHSLQAPCWECYQLIGIDISIQNTENVTGGLQA